jgi:DNA-binding CsgD family transcriptional regulator
LIRLADGETTREIAAALGCSVRLVKLEICRLGFRTRPQAVATAIRSGWI